MDIRDNMDILVELSMLAWISMEKHGYPHNHGSTDRSTWDTSLMGKLHAIIFMIWTLSFTFIESSFVPSRRSLTYGSF